METIRDGGEGYEAPQSDASEALVLESSESDVLAADSIPLS